MFLQFDSYKLQLSPCFQQTFEYGYKSMALYLELHKSWEHSLQYFCKVMASIFYICWRALCHQFCLLSECMLQELYLVVPWNWGHIHHYTRILLVIKFCITQPFFNLPRTTCDVCILLAHHLAPQPNYKHILSFLYKHLIQVIYILTPLASFPHRIPHACKLQDLGLVLHKS